MEFEWDPNKALVNLAKHGLDFETAPAIWTEPMLPIGFRMADSERREIALGLAPPDAKIVVVVYTLRNDVVRLISIRRARRNERAAYQAKFGRGG